MKQRRLAILLVVMVVLAAGRFVLPSSTKAYSIAEPVAQPAAALARAAQTSSIQPVASPSLASSQEDDAPGNAFAVRVVPAPPAPVLPAVVAMRPSTPMPAAPVAPTPAPPPLQVIGTYDDGGPAAVFVATPTGTLIARTGTVLLAEYRVTGITPQQVSLTEVSTQRTLQLVVPSGAPR